MKKIVIKYGHILSAFALVITTMASSRTCASILHEPKLPESAKKLRKF